MIRNSSARNRFSSADLFRVGGTRGPPTPRGTPHTPRGTPHTPRPPPPPPPTPEPSSADDCEYISLSRLLGTEEPAPAPDAEVYIPLSELLKSLTEEGFDSDVSEAMNDLGESAIDDVVVVNIDRPAPIIATQSVAIPQALIAAAEVILEDGKKSAGRSRHAAITSSLPQIFPDQSPDELFGMRKNAGSRNRRVPFLRLGVRAALAEWLENAKRAR